MTNIQFKGDPASPEYKISDEFLPDKESTWHFPAEKDGWMLAHNALRGQMQMMKEALQAEAGLTNCKCGRSKPSMEL
jgi:hypothetical protein